MTTVDDEQERDVPQRAVEALLDANRRAVAAGYAVVLVQNGKLIRRIADQVVVLKTIRPRRKVAVRVKQRKP